MHVSVPEDTKLPELLEPDPDDKIDVANRKRNKEAEAMPTSIKNSSDYYVQRGTAPQEIQIIIERERVDLGYKIRLKCKKQ